MRNKNNSLGRRFLVPSLLLVLVLSACGGSKADATPTLSVDAIFTAAFQTLEAQQATQLALTPPTSTPSPSPFPTLPPPSPIATVAFGSSTPSLGGGATACDKASFVSDVTIPDGTVIKPGEKFTKTWRIYNSGTCNWSTSYKWVFVSGDAMGGSSLALPAAVTSGSQTDISVVLTAPSTNGTFKGYWRMQNATGVSFGDQPWVEIKVNAGSGTAIPTSSSGNVTIWGNAGADGVKITYTGTGGGASGVVNADGSGNYSFSVAKGWSGSVTPTKGIYVFSPVSRSYNNVQSDQTSQDYSIEEGATATPTATP